MNKTIITLLSITGLSLSANAQTAYGLDFADPGWVNDKTGETSEFQKNEAGKGNEAGWNATHSLANINGSGVGVTLELSHEPHAWNIESRPALDTYFPSEHGKSGAILRVWNDTANIKEGEIPALSLTFTQDITLQQLGLEGYRADDAWQVQIFDKDGTVIRPNWKDATQATSVNPGDPLSGSPINLLTTTGVNGATGAETTSLGTYTPAGFILFNEEQKSTRGASILNYNDTTAVRKIVLSMIEVDRAGAATGDPSDQSMYVGSGILAKEFSTVPEPSSTALLGLAGLGMLVRRQRK